MGSGYAVERELGGGGMSRVFIAQETSLGRNVVVKVLPPEMAGSVNVDRFRREIQLAARLQHACIVPLLSAGVADGMPYYTMPLVDGESLRRRIARGGELPVNEAVRLLRDVAEALSYAHEQGVIHRDIKPDNILLTKHHALVTDFGVAKALSASTLGDAVTSIGVAIGTPAYMAPEQAVGDPQVDHRADIYAFGVTAYEMLSGEKPFVGRSPQAVMAAQATETPKPLESLRATVPQQLAELVGRCLAKRAADRPQSADELLEALEAIAMPTGLTPTSQPPTAKSRRAWTIGVAAVVVVAAIAAGAVARMKSSGAPRLNPKRVVVAEFENQTGDSSLAPLGRMAADYLTQGLAQVSGIQVASLSGGTILGDAGSRPSASGTARATAAAATARAGTVVWGTYYKDGDTLRIQAQITDANTGRVVRPLAVVVGQAAERMRLLQALRSQVAGAIAAIFSGRWESTGTSLPNWDAYQEFIEGVKYFGSDYPNAIVHLKRSIAADSTFVLPFQMLAGAYSNTSDWKNLDSLVRRVAPMRFGRAGTDADIIEWITALLHHDYAAQLAISERLVARDSMDSQFYGIGVINNWLNRPRAALVALANAKTFAAVAPTFYWTQRTTSSHLLGDFKTELADARRFRIDAPQATLSLRAIGRAAAAFGDLRTVNVMLDSLRILGSGSTNIGAALDEIALELRAHGRGAEARAAFAQAIEWQRSRPADAQRTPAARAALGNVLYDAESWSDARTLYETLAREDTTNLAHLGTLGALAARGGDRAEATRIKSQLEQLQGPYLFGTNTYQRARIAALLGDRAGAVALLKQATSEGFAFTLTYHRAIDFESLRDFAPFQDFLRPKG